MTEAQSERSTERTWEISDIDGNNKRRVTLAQYRAELDARKVMTKPIMDALRRGDLEACGAAQAAMRKRFPK
jgi:hypothetical protein